MKITYDKSYGQAYISLDPHCEAKGKGTHRTVEIQRSVLVDIHPDGSLCGIELIGGTILEGLQKVGEVELL